jgi:carboxyl-terminal processing protease
VISARLPAALRRALAVGLAGLFLTLGSCALGDVSFSQQAGRTENADQRMISRVVERTYRAISDRWIDAPDFRNYTTQALRAVAAVDGGLDIAEDERGVHLMRRGVLVAERPMPASPADARAWSTLFSDLSESMITASPTIGGTDQERLIKLTMDAITHQLDRNSRYSDPDDARDNRFMRDGAGGIGITLQIEGEETVISAVQDGGPAERAGVKVGDRLVGVAGKRVTAQQLREIVRDVRGPIGEPVVLTVLRPSDKRERDISIVRDKVIPTTVAVAHRGNLLHVQLTGFNNATADAMRKALRRAQETNGGQISGIILDMRGNPGGLLDQSVSVAELFIDSGLIATTNGRHPDSKQVFRSVGTAEFGNVPMVVVMNGRSASAAEVLGAALQERGRAVIVGSVSYGKGSVQTVMRLPNGGELVLTWSKLYGPSGITWNEVGLLPAVCASRYSAATDLDRQIDSSIASWRDANARWHKSGHPTALQIQQLRAVCAPVSDAADRDLELADRILRDQTLYARWVRVSTENVAERRQ